MSPGLRVVLDLEAGLALDDLRTRVREYEIASSYDASLNAFRDVTQGALDLRQADHQAALLTWLRSWGCRHLSHASQEVTVAVLLAWAHEWTPQLPDPSRVLTELSSQEMTVGAVAFARLAEAVAGIRKQATGDVEVTFGPTAAAKTLYALRPNAYAPWDELIRDGLGLGENDAAYRRYLELVAVALARTAERAGVSVRELPALVGRQSSSPPKLIDEYDWIRITRAPVD